MPDKTFRGCFEQICWKCMNKGGKDFGTIKCTKAEFAEMGEGAWWMHEKCMTPEDKRAYFGEEDGGGDGDEEDADRGRTEAQAGRPTSASASSIASSAWECTSLITIQSLGPSSEKVSSPDRTPAAVIPKTTATQEQKVLHGCRAAIMLARRAMTPDDACSLRSRGAAAGRALAYAPGPTALHLGRSPGRRRTG